MTNLERARECLDAMKAWRNVNGESGWDAMLAAAIEDARQEERHRAVEFVRDKCGGWVSRDFSEQAAAALNLALSDPIPA